jgi:hypothetical protein
MRKRFFHWFLEFPEIVQRGGFDCILGNPPYLGGTHLSGTYGREFCNYVKHAYAPTGLSELVVFFLRRYMSLLRPQGFMAFITTNSIKDGDIREDGLEVAVANGMAINMAVRALRWPGQAKLVVSLIALHRGNWQQTCFLDGRPYPSISTFLDPESETRKPVPLGRQSEFMYEGVKWSGNTLLLEQPEAERLLQEGRQNAEVLKLVINGDELNSEPDQRAKRWIAYFSDWPWDRVRKYETVIRFLSERSPQFAHQIQQQDPSAYRLLRPRIEMMTRLTALRNCFVCAATTKYLNFTFCPSSFAFSHALKVFTTDRWDLYAVVQSTIHEVWARKYSGCKRPTIPSPHPRWAAECLGNPWVRLRGRCAQLSSSKAIVWAAALVLPLWVAQRQLSENGERDG